MTRLMMTVIVTLVVAGIALATAGVLRFQNTSDQAGVTIDKRELKQKTQQAVETTGEFGGKILDKTGGRCTRQPNGCDDRRAIRIRRRQRRRPTIKAHDNRTAARPRPRTGSTRPLSRRRIDCRYEKLSFAVIASFCGISRERRSVMRLATCALALLGLLCVATTFAVAQETADQRDDARSSGRSGSGCGLARTMACVPARSRLVRLLPIPAVLRLSAGLLLVRVAAVLRLLCPAVSGLLRPVRFRLHVPRATKVVQLCVLMRQSDDASIFGGRPRKTGGGSL